MNQLETNEVKISWDAPSFPSVDKYECEVKPKEGESKKYEPANNTDTAIVIDLNSGIYDVTVFAIIDEDKDEATEEFAIVSGKLACTN